MTSLTLQLPNHLYESLKKAANKAGTSPEAIATQWLEMTVNNLDDDPIDISIVIPCYNEELNIVKLLNSLMEVLNNINMIYEIICVNDGSQDNTLEKLIEFHENNPSIKIINLSRNFGKEIALTAGIDYTIGAAVIPIDADLQDPPELIYELVKKWRQGYDVIYAIRNNRQGESWFKKSTAKIFYHLIGKLSVTPIPPNTGDFRLLDRRVVNVLKTI